MDAFLRGLSAIYVAAFLSLFTQIPGLYGEDGLQPVSAQLTQWRTQLGSEDSLVGMGAVPSLVWLHRDLDVLPEVVMVSGCPLLYHPREH